MQKVQIRGSGALFETAFFDTPRNPVASLILFSTLFVMTNPKKQGKSRRIASVLPVRVTPCIKGRGSYERFFEYKFEPTNTYSNSISDSNCLATTDSEVPGILGALVMPNSICILVMTKASAPDSEVISVSFEENIDGDLELSTESISGKKKKGAQRIKAGHKICTLSFANGKSCTMLSPISGMVLELNYEQLQSTPSLVRSEPFGRGHIAVIKPEDDLLPCLENEREQGSNPSDENPFATCTFEKTKASAGIDASTAMLSDATRATDDSQKTMGITAAEQKATSTARQCFAFSSGAGCLRGDACRFQHVVFKNGIPEVVNGGSASDRNRMKKRKAADDGCHDYRRGNCYRGDKCIFLHE